MGDLLQIVLAGVPAIVWTVALWSTVRTIRAIPLMESVAPPEPEDWPSVSIVSPACNEAGHVEAAILAALAQDYPRLQVVAVDDRSSDATGAILDRLADSDPRVVARHVQSVPEGWLGKLHALHVGVAHADADWLLFTDADVSLQPGALRRIIAYAESRNLDFVTAVPTIEPVGVLVDACYGAMGVLMTAGGRLWGVSNPDSDAVAGMGAFIMFRRRFYDTTPGLPWLRLEVADDVGMGLLAKRHGGRCEVLNARGLIRIPWYASLPEMFTKLQKNWFGIVGRFRVGRLLTIAALMTYLTTSGLLAFAGGPPVAVALAVIAPALLVLSSVIAAGWMGRRLLPSALAPLGFLLLVAMMIYAAYRGARCGGIEWRGVVYPSSQLAAAQRVRI